MVPQLTPEQRQRASQLAAAARARRAEIRRDLKTGIASLVQVVELARIDQIVASMRVRDVISSLPAMGPVRTARTMADLRISEGKKLGGLGHVQREALMQFARSRSES